MNLSRTLFDRATSAVLGGLSARDNREILPLRYDVVGELKPAVHGLKVVVSGGLRERDAIVRALDGLDGVMLGREAYHRPVALARRDSLVFGVDPSTDEAHSA